ncbi:hypothetical protein GTP46_28150 [Duganella sp. FT135W]|uniref:Uncharacterized protein n=1 Tax=Duganella flavida TaxID=2692175 RepID=A0A6L8KGB9_9BURK|nr:hypothetical protein [Duganella flavida]MYM26503.1 hypothetical protein [Duganella flavida]
MSMWGNDSGGRDTSHLYMGLAMGAADRANRAEDENDKLYAAIADFYANKIVWQAIAIAYRQLCEAMLDELASATEPKHLNNPAHAGTRTLFIRNALEQQISGATKFYQDNGHAKKWPGLLSKVRGRALTKVEDMIFKMDLHADGHFREARRRAGSAGKRNR